MTSLSGEGRDEVRAAGTARVAARQQTLRALVVVALFAAALYMLRSWLTPILWAGLIALATWPLHDRLERRFGARATPAIAFFLTAAVVALFVMPFAYVMVRGWHEVPALLHLWTASRDSGLPPPPWLSGVPLAGPWLAERWTEALGTPGALSAFVHSLAAEFDLARGRTLATLIAHDAMKFFFCIVVLFFLYLDGRALAAQIDAVAFAQLGPPGRRMLPVVANAVAGAVNGLVVVGLGVAVLMTLACMVAGVPHPAAIGLATGLLGMVPFGAMVAIVGVAVYLLASGSTASAIVLLGLGAIVIFVADHFVRPKLMSRGTRLPLVLALLAILGGLETFGVLGLFVGPTVLAIVVAVWRELGAPGARVAA